MGDDEGHRRETYAFEIVDVGSPNAQGALDQYFTELDRRFAGGFKASEGGSDRDRDQMNHPNGLFLVLRDEAGKVVGCGGLQKVDLGVAEIKRMWVSETVRGLGLGRRVLAELEQRAAQLGYERVVLDTNGVLIEARSLYAVSGYREVDRYNDNPYAEHWFEKELTGN